MRNKVIFIFLVLIVVLFVAYRYVYKDHRDIAAENGVYVTTAKAIFSEFQKSEVNANTKYLDKTIEITGTISGVDFEAKSIVIDEKLFATFKDKIPETFQPNSKIKIKGRFIGYDVLLEELKMDQCILETR